MRSLFWLRDWARRHGQRRKAPSLRLAALWLEDRTVPAVSILNNGGYAGLNINQSGGATPPDTGGAAGPSVYIETVNTEVAIYNPKATGASAITDGLNHFFATTGGLAVNGLSDATGVYVDTIGRFIIAE